jgi:hypothetical protein
MTQEADSTSAGKRYSIGTVGAGARVIQGDGNAWSESLSLQPGGAQVAREIAEIVERVRADHALEPDDRDLAIEKTQAVAAALTDAGDSPGHLRKALRDAQSFLNAKAEWAWNRLREVLGSEAGLQILGSITDVAARAAIQGILGISIG